MRPGFFWGAILVVAPLYLKFGETVNIRNSKLFFAIFACLLSLLLFEKAKVKVGYVFAYFLTAGLFSFLPISDYSIVYWIFGGLIMATACQLISLFDGNDLKIIKNSIAITCVIQSLWVIANHFGIDPYGPIMYLAGYGKHIINPAQLPTGSVGHPTMAGVLIACTTPALIRGKWRYLIPLPLIGCFLTGSSMSLIALVVGLAVFAFVKLDKKYTIFSLSGLMGTGLYFFFFGFPGGYFSDTARVPVWKSALLWPENLEILFGKGIGYFATYYTATFHPQKPFLQAHNEAIDLYVAYGLIGVVLAALVLKPIIFQRKEPIFLACFWAILINSLGNFPLQMGPMALIAMVCFSVLHRSKYGSNIC